MCEPTTIMLMITAASAMASLAAQKQAADSQDASNKRQYDSAVQARSENANQVSLERTQATDAASQKINANNTSQREAQATQIAAAGPGGLSVDALLGDMGRKGATYNQSVNENLDRTNMALDNQLTNVNRGAASAINGLKTPQQPDYLGTALKIGGAAYGSYTAGGSGASSSNLFQSGAGGNLTGYQDRHG